MEESHVQPDPWCGDYCSHHIVACRPNARQDHEIINYTIAIAE
jgi:hypothetical protein